MRLILCNRCKKEIKTPKAGFINLDMRDVKTGDLVGNREYDDWDLCDDCMQKIRDFIHMKPEKPAENVTVKVSDDLIQKLTEEKPKAKSGRHPQADMIIELAKEGADVHEIMEKAGCSKPTAMKYMREADNEQ